MFCEHCGKELSAEALFCPYCGTPVSKASSMGEKVNDTANNIDETVKNFSKDVDEKVDNAVDDIKNTFSQNSNYTNAVKLNCNRSLVALILLSIITCGIYGFYYVYNMAHDINIACGGDGKETGGLGTYILFSILTCGIYSLYWEYELGNRLAENAPRYGLQFQENGTTVLCWKIFGCLLCVLGTFLGDNILITNSNAICEAYNREHGLS